MGTSACRRRTRSRASPAHLRATAVDDGAAQVVLTGAGVTQPRLVPLQGHEGVLYDVLGRVALPCQGRREADQRQVVAVEEQRQRLITGRHAVTAQRGEDGPARDVLWFSRGHGHVQ